jgi:large subunit ribosomal protein L22
MEQVAIAKGRYLRHSALKSKLVLDQIRNKQVENAFRFLKFCPKVVARDVEKILKSAVANAQVIEGDLDTKDMYICLADVGPGPTFKRWRARARGRASRILKRTVHITLGVGRFVEEDTEV